VIADCEVFIRAATAVWLSSSSRPAACSELLHLLRLPDLDPADAIGTFWGHAGTRPFGELLIDLEEDGPPGGRVRGLP